MDTKCTYCGKLTLHKPDNRSKTGNVFCDTSCAAKHNNQTFPKRRASKHCAKCGAPIRADTLSKYCGDCYRQARSLNSKTLAEATYNKTDNNRYTYIRAMARKGYLSSDRPKCCAVCGYDRHIEICHIENIADSPKTAMISDINDLDNLTALCPNHHWEFDHSLLKVGRIGLEPITRKL